MKALGILKASGILGILGLWENLKALGILKASGILVFILVLIILPRIRSVLSGVMNESKMKRWGGGTSEDVAAATDQTFVGCEESQIIDITKFSVFEYRHYFGCWHIFNLQFSIFSIFNFIAPQTPFVLR